MEAANPSVTLNPDKKIQLTNLNDTLVSDQPVSAIAASYSPRDHLMYKNKLQEYTHRASLPLPIYHTISEGYPHDPMFRSTVLVDGKEYTTQETFMHRKESEQSVAKIALTSITENIKHEGYCIDHEDIVFCKTMYYSCKSIIKEYVDKLQLEKPTYNTVRLDGLLPGFESFVILNGVTYKGNAARNKKDAEQFAAQSAICTLLVCESAGRIISQIIKSKVKPLAANDRLDPQIDQQSSAPMVNENIQTKAPMINSVLPMSVNLQENSVLHPPHHEFTKIKTEPSSEGMVLPMAFVHPGLGQPTDASLGAKKKKKKNKRKANKRSRTEYQSLIAAVSSNQAAPYPVS